ncbi:Uncharacterized protein FWK35_00003817, partial [Aphis craccivora]
MNEVWCLETWNSTGFVPQDITGFSNFKSKNNINQNDGALIYINNNLRNISVEQQPLFSEASCLKI